MVLRRTGGSEKNRYKKVVVREQLGLLVIFNLCCSGSWAGDLSVTALLVDPLLEDLHVPSVPSELLP